MSENLLVVLLNEYSLKNDLLFVLLKEYSQNNEFIKKTY